MGGVSMARIGITKLSQYMLDRIDNTNLVEVDKVERYLQIIKYLRDLELDIKERGLTTITKNGAQEFAKANPSIEVWIKLNKELDKLEDSINFIAKNESENKGSIVNNVVDARERMLGRG